MNLGAGDVAPLVKFLLLVYEAWAASPEVSRLGLVMQICDPNLGEVGPSSWDGHGHSQSCIYLVRSKDLFLCLYKSFSFEVLGFVM